MDEAFQNTPGNIQLAFLKDGADFLPGSLTMEYNAVSQLIFFTLLDDF
jgi:hypothetical protein